MGNNGVVSPNGNSLRKTIGHCHRIRAKKDQINHFSDEENEAERLYELIEYPCP